MWIGNVQLHEPCYMYGRTTPSAQISVKGCVQASSRQLARDITELPYNYTVIVNYRFPWYTCIYTIKFMAPPF